MRGEGDVSLMGFPARWQCREQDGMRAAIDIAGGIHNQDSFKAAIEVATGIAAGPPVEIPIQEWMGRLPLMARLLGHNVIPRGTLVQHVFRTEVRGVVIWSDVRHDLVLVQLDTGRCAKALYHTVAVRPAALSRMQALDV